jgi:hypothetical protein
MSSRRRRRASTEELVCATTVGKTHGNGQHAAKQNRIREYCRTFHGRSPVSISILNTDRMVHERGFSADMLLESRRLCSISFECFRHHSHFRREPSMIRFRIAILAAFSCLLLCVALAAQANPAGAPGNFDKPACVRQPMPTSPRLSPTIL